MFIVPLVSVEKEISIENIKDFDQYINHKFDGDEMRALMMDTDEYKFLFNYVFPLPRMLSLLTIYSANAVSRSLPETNTAFGKTREALRSLYYTLSADSEGGEWWQDESHATKEHGGNAGL